MERISFVVPGQPFPMPRPRHFAVKKGPMAGRIMTVSNVKNHPSTVYKEAILIAGRIAMAGRPPLEGPLKLVATFTMERPQRLIWKNKPMLREWHTSPRCNLDNLVKGIADVLQGIMFFDDGQIAVMELGKCIAGGDEQPRTTVVVEQLR
jgi:Holliday junction resolvase RusA-like endonuclease